jgi:hypothetical protein
MIAFIPEMPSKHISITMSNYLQRPYAFAVQRSRKVWIWRHARMTRAHDVPDGRQYHNNETIAFFGDAWDVFASD